jgi:hypothetical protein
MQMSNHSYVGNQMYPRANFERHREQKIIELYFRNISSLSLEISVHSFIASRFLIKFAYIHWLPLELVLHLELGNVTSSQLTSRNMKSVQKFEAGTHPAPVSIRMEVSSSFAAVRTRQRAMPLPDKDTLHTRVRICAPRPSLPFNYYFG